MIMEDVLTQYRNIFTESGTIVVDNIIASSYTGNNTVDAKLQHFALKSSYYALSWYNESLVYDEYQMVELRNYIYNKLLKPLLKFHNNVPDYICFDNMVAIIGVIVVTTLGTKASRMV